MVGFFHFDALAVVMLVLVSFIGLVVLSFARRYLHGDSQHFQSMMLIISLVISVIALVAANHLLILLIAWASSNILLLKLMLHKSTWRAARASVTLAAKTLGFGWLCLAIACGLLYYTTGTSNIQSILQTPINSPLTFLALILVLIAAMTQSAIWPFHRWLTSSLNSPTPVSAIMHAGLINGGGFLLVRFAPLYLTSLNLLLLIFILGLLTALLGTLWKLMQHDVKRMLACSTLGQMGFMFMQCGLGLFPAAVGHLCWHGLFKAYLFLASGSNAREKRVNLSQPLTARHLLFALLCGVIGSVSFMLMGDFAMFAMNSTWVMVSIAFIATAQLALTILQTISCAWHRLFAALIFSSGLGAIYGGSVYLMENALASLNIFQAQPLHVVYLLGMGLLLLTWLVMVLGRYKYLAVKRLPQWVLWSYVKLFNASQPHPTTITAHRNHYQYN
jgi:NAD(P)H-quinone oxidoreductase subunit 5